MSGHRPFREISARVRARPGAEERITAHVHRIEKEIVDYEQAEALKELRRLLTLGGRLKIITATAAPGKTVPSPDPADYVLHDAVALRAGEDGVWVATSAEGDATVGTPAALLRRLQRWRATPAPAE